MGLNTSLDGILGATTPAAATITTLVVSGATQMAQPDVAVVNASATVTVTNMRARIITSTSGAAVAATLPTGTLMDDLYSASVDVGYEWDIINTGPNTVTVGAGVDHTVVGNMAVATATSGKFRSCRDATKLWVTYRV